ncbi:MAG: cytochrome c maturation protein CcmE [Saprospiraceae bacterium]|nr:cytochrome c maturation protein CcmE [Saprospiraceae bacterium]
MKKIHFIGLGLIVLAVILLFTASGDMGTYSNFEDARTTNKKVKVVGQLSKDKEMYYDPEKDPNFFSFYLEDVNGEQQKVVLLQQKPQDFEMSEQVVVTGKMKDEQFVATEILMKCPSKYKNEEIFIKSES